MYPSIRTETAFYSPVIPSLSDQRYTLATKGYNGAEAHKLKSISSIETRTKYLKQNLETTINHVFEDSAVSFSNSYQINNKGEIISYPDGTVLRIDPDERGGFNEVGIKAAITGALRHPDKVVLLYSPPGPVVFDDNPNNKFKDIKPYIDGQLYIMHADESKVKNVAISISHEGEPWIEAIMPQTYHEASSRNSAIDKVKYYITHPVLTSKSIDAFLENQDFQDRVIFNNKDNVKFSLSQTLTLIRQSLADQLAQSPVVQYILQSINVEYITEYDIDRIYGTLAQEYMKEKGISTLTLGGSCGGSEIKFDPVSNSLDNLSTSFRMITQGKNALKMKDYREDPNLCRCSAASGPHFHCPGIDKNTKKPCRHAIVVGKGITTCPACGTGKTC